jgi:predicted ATP-grasp superfamily ATP-dependent carboligase
VSTVLVLEGENKNALAAVRSLGRAGLRVITGSTRRVTRSGVSTYASQNVLYAPPQDERAFVASVLEIVRRCGVDVLLPIGDASCRILSKHRPEIEGRVAIPIADWEAMRIASDKQASVSFAGQLGVPVPRTYDAKSDVEQYPVVVKSRLGAGGVSYVNSPEQLAAIDADECILQEYVTGDGYGFFTLFERGRERAIFMHRRIREYPITGGASTAAESIYDEKLRDLGLAVLKGLQWHGVAMVEFKRDVTDGNYKLMEINPKFWGSLDLAIAAGVDFPRLAVEMALGRLAEDVMKYDVGLRFRWVFDDLVRLAAQPSSFRAFIRDFHNGTKSDITSGDLKPAVYDAGRAIGSVVVRGSTGRLRYPHGRPQQAFSSHDQPLLK